MDQKQTGIKQAARVQQKNWPGGVINLSRARVRITLGDKVLWASVEDNATTHALVGELPITLALKDLDGQTAVYYQDVDQFPTDNLQMGGYKAGDIVFWPEKDRFCAVLQKRRTPVYRAGTGSRRKAIAAFGRKSAGHL